MNGWKGPFVGRLVFLNSERKEQKMKLLQNAASAHNLAETVLSYEALTPYPSAQNRDFWDHLPPELSSFLVSEGEQYLGFDWPTVLATTYMEFCRSGNREANQIPSFGRRSALGRLVAAECIENKGRFLDDIVNGVWAICEETTWAISAHIYISPNSNMLPDKNDPIIDLFAAETAGLLSFVYYLLKEKLDAVTPLVTKRILQELQERTVLPYLQRDDYWWMGLSGKKVNNWDPWCNSNVLWTAILTCHDQSQRVAIVEKAVRTIDNFIDTYHPDGACDEGPGYWARAGASLMDCLELLSLITDGKLEIYQEPLIQNMGRFIAHARITDKYYMNFADAAAVCNAEPYRIYRYGKSIGDPMLMAEGAYLRAMRPEVFPLPKTFSANRFFPDLLVYEEIAAYQGKPECARDIWYDGTQVLIARETETREKGLFLAAKGGHNDESHNHNDVGSLIVFDDAAPILIDIGVEVYTAKTFSPDRYSIWAMQSGYHNLPTIGKTQQSPGAAYCAKILSCEIAPEKTVLSMDIAGAYDRAADSWVRSFTLDRTCSKVTVEDTFRLPEAQIIHQSFMTLQKPKILIDGVKIGGRKLVFEGLDMRAEIQPCPLTDANLKSSWGDILYRIYLTANTPVRQGTLRYELIKD